MSDDGLGKKFNSFFIEYHSSLMNTDFKGSFTSRVLNVFENIEVGRIKSKLLDGCQKEVVCPHCNKAHQFYTVIDDNEAMADIVAYLKVALVDVPEWWDLEDIYDPFLLMEVRNKAMEYEQSFFRRGRTGESAPSDVRGGAVDSKEQSKERQPTSSVTKVVGGEVQDPLDL